ncbi:DUF948 domain-containing protein [Ignavibacterium sp.]|uniref:DUF948 domain-containing protein n=1 Tax=Ignavibacterium sp. TaxID=2651167 RepID=UPI00307E0780
MDIIQVLTAILLLSAAMLCIALIIYFKKIVGSMLELEKEIKDLNSTLKPLISSTLELTKNLNEVSDSAKKQLHVSKSILDDIRFRVDKVLELEEKVRDGIDYAVTPLIQNLSAIGKGIETFWRKFKER